MDKKIKPYLFAIGAFLAAWQIDSFSLEFPSIMGALTCAVLGYGSPKGNKSL
jgi:hypothetical protein